MNDTKEVTSGVQELIDKLKNQGVNEGERQANQLIKEAQNEASRIISEAKSESDRLLLEARHQIEVERNSAHDAIKNAFRDTEIALRSKFKEAFSLYLKQLVSLELRDKDFLKQLILAIAGLKKPKLDEADRAEILLPSKLFETEGSTTHLSQEGKKNLQHLVLGITGEMLREGVELKVSPDVSGGIRVRLVGDDINIDLTDEALSSLLLKYLLPRYRDIISGQM